MRQLTLLLALTMSLAMPAAAELIVVNTDKSVPEVMDALEAAVGKAGATVFARVDHEKGAQSVGMELPPSQVLIFGNPKLGNAAMTADIRAALFLPLKVAAYASGEGAVLTYQDPADMFGGLDIAPEAEVVKKMQGALAKLTNAAAN